MASTRVLLVVALLASLAGVALSADSSTSPSAVTFNFHDYLIADNSSTSLLGRYFDNHTETGDIENALTVVVDFDDNSNGAWRTGRDEDSLTQLFPFSFVQHPAGHPTSVGDWHGADESFYVLQINAPDKFTITVQPRRSKQQQPGEEAEESEDGVVIYSLRKKAEPAAKTFFQQYGTWLMLAVFFVVNMWVKSRQQMQGGQAPTAAAPAAIAAKKSK